MAARLSLRQAVPAPVRAPAGPARPLIEHVPDVLAFRHTSGGHFALPGVLSPRAPLLSVSSAALSAEPLVERTPMIVFENVVGHDWGFFTREDARMHVQTVDAKARGGKNKKKVWLENAGRRAYAFTGQLSARQQAELQERVTEERPNIEALWINQMIKTGWLDCQLAGDVVTLTAYRGQNTRLTRYVALREFFPGKYAKGVAHRWDETAPEAVLDDDRALLVVGQDTEAWDRRASIDLARVVFVD